MANFSLVGTQYGGWCIDLDLIPEKSTIISAGVGEDISFDKELIKLKKCLVLGIDPTAKSAKYISENPQDNFQFINKALSHNLDKTVIYKNHNPEWVSESTLRSHNMVSEDYYEAESITIHELLKNYDNVSLIKMDVEGSEYDIVSNLKPMEVPQVCVEFHHFCSNKTWEDTKKCILHMGTIGYERFIEKPNSQQRYTELTFIHNRVDV